VIRAREQAKQDRDRGRRSVITPAEPAADQLTIDGVLAELARDEQGRPVTVLAQPAALATTDADQ